MPKTVLDRLNEADALLTNIDTDVEALSSALDAARASINSARAMVLAGAEVEA